MGERGRVVAVCVGVPAPLETAGKGVVPSGIVKRPVAGPRMVRFLNLDGDAQADRRVHGGPDQAVYCYPHEHVTAWREELGRDDLVPGRLGENLTIEGYLEDDVRQGDVFRAGRALLEATKPRMPCFKLAAHIGSGAFGKRFVELRRTGWYCRVLEEGPVAAGDAFVRVRRGEGRTIAEMVGSREAGIGTGEGR